jgi:hypothetical protein
VENVNAVVDPIKIIKKRKQEKNDGEKTEYDETIRQKDKEWSERTSLHVCHLRRVPFGQVRIEFTCLKERCRSV